MINNLAGEFGLHFMVGAGLATFVAILFYRLKKRRPFFRFGGHDVMSLGTSSSWMLWYLFAFTFEFVTSFLTHRMYVELALSIYQAVAFALGLFLVDRITMALEPEAYWQPRGKSAAIDVPATVVTAPLPPREEPAALPAPTAEPDSSWLSKKVAGVVRDVSSIPAAVSAGRKAAADAQQAEEEADRKAKQANYKKGLQGY